MKLSAPLQALATVVLGGTILWFGKPFLIPFAYAFLIAMVLYPLTRWLEKKGMGRTLSIALPLILLCLLFVGLAVLLGYEMAVLSGEWPLIQQQIDPFLARIHTQLEHEFGWTTDEQTAWVRNNLDQLSKNTGTFLRDSLVGMFEALFNLVIIPIYIALLLAFRGRLVKFLGEILPAGMRHKLPMVLDDTVKVFSRFIRGMVLVYLIVGLLNTVGLWIIGVDNAPLYGMLTALMTIIPYFGIVISALLPITVSWLHTGTLWQPMGIITVFTIVQYLEANLIFPYVVGRHVNLNTLAAIVSIFLGALFWGVSGMILFLPFVAVFRIFANHFPELKPWSSLLGK